MFQPISTLRGGVQHFGGRVDQRVADGGGDVAAALAAHGGDGGDAVGFAGGEEDLFAFHHIHKTDRHPDDERGPQPGLDLLGDGQKGCGGIADSQDGTGCSCAARCMEATARVVPAALAAAATSGSAM